MPLVAASRALDNFLALAWEIEIHAPPSLLQLAPTIAVDHDLSAAYDAHYLALSQFLGRESWTDDQRLLQHVEARLPYVRPLAEFTSAESRGPRTSALGSGRGQFPAAPVPRIRPRRPTGRGS
jgi:hypothetical protein